MDSGERRLFDRSLAAATEASSGADLDAALTELGWHEALAGDPRPAVSLLFAHQGRVLSTSSALDDVVAGALGAGGDPAMAVVLPGPGDASPPGRPGAGGLVVEGLGTARLLRAGTALVVAATPDAMVGAVVKTSELTVRPVLGIDPELGLARVTGATSAPSAPCAIALPSWNEAVARARLALGHEMVGAAAAMLELARRHAVERVQFGRPIAAFQAVRHRLADTVVAVESARALLEAAWDDGGPDMAAMAKAVSGQAARTASRHCQQVLAGMGFTTEHPLHRYVRRVLVLDELFGSARSLSAQLGRQVLASRRLPTPIPL